MSASVLYIVLICILVCQNYTTVYYNRSISTGPPPPPNNINIILTDTTADITWTQSDYSSQYCSIASYTISTNTSNSIITTTDTSTSISLTGLSVGIYCISIASIDIANRIGTYSQHECFEIIGQWIE